MLGAKGWSDFNARHVGLCVGVHKLVEKSIEVQISIIQCAKCYNKGQRQCHRNPEMGVNTPSEREKHKGAVTCELGLENA